MRKILLALYILYLPFQLKLPNTPVITILNIFLFFLAIAFVFSKTRNTTRIPFETPLLLFLLIWLLSYLHTIFIPRGIWASEVTTEFKRIISLVFGYFVFSRLVTTKKDWRFLQYIFFLSVVLVALDTWKGGMLAGPNFADFKRSSGPFATGWTASDIAGGFLAIFTPFIFSYTLLETKNISKILGAISSIVCLVGLFATYSRGSMIAFAVGIIFVIFLSLKKIFVQSRPTGMLVVLFLLLLFFSWERWVPGSIVQRISGTVKTSEFSDEVTLDKSSQMRTMIWQRGLELFEENPIFGIGFKQAEYEMGVDTHNAFILIAAEMGMFGILIFVWFLWRILQESVRLLKTEYGFFGLGFIGCVISFIIVNMFYSNFFRDTVVGSFWAALGLLAASRQFFVEKKTSRKSKVC